MRTSEIDLSPHNTYLQTCVLLMTKQLKLESNGHWKQDGRWRGGDSAIKSKKISVRIWFLLWQGAKEDGKGSVCVGGHGSGYMRPKCC